jgi:2',3'-cyclic-nucleotide 2'-phosphodiesterase (5'-nucleotidase family)
MLLKRTQKENLIEATYDSSNILSSKYDKDSKKLIITFKRGAQYVYMGVSSSDYLRFETAESQGAVLNSHIKSYSFEKGEVVDAKVIEEEIDKLKQEELRLKQQSIIDNMELLISDFDINSEFNETKLMNLVNKIEKYFNPGNE